MCPLSMIEKTFQNNYTVVNRHSVIPSYLFIWKGSLEYYTSEYKAWMLHASGNLTSIAHLVIIIKLITKHNVFAFFLCFIVIILLYIARLNIPKMFN